MNQKHEFSGEATAVRARIRLLRSFDQISHSYLGYALVLGGTLDGMPTGRTRIAVRPRAHGRHPSTIGGRLAGNAVAVPNPETK